MGKNRLVNIDYIGYLTETDGRVKYCEEPIQDHSDIVYELYDYSRDSHLSVEQVKAKYKELFPYNFWWQGYCLENEYSDVEYSVITNPLDIFNDYKVKLRKTLAKTNEKFRELRRELSKEKNFNLCTFKAEWKEELQDEENQLTQKYINLFIDAVEESMPALNYEYTVNKLKEACDVSAYSSDQKGWSDFKFLKVSDDIGVQVKTNFCYGNSSYFIVTLIYKGINLVPYSFLVTYYNARSVDIIRGTRDYKRCRASWKPALEFAAKCANEAKENPLEFIHEYLLSEISVLVDRLSDLVNNPDAFIGSMVKFRNKTSEDVNLNHLDDLNFDKMLIKDDELSTTIVALKVTDALKFIKDLQVLSQDFHFLTSYIEEILNLNFRIVPLINKVKSKVDSSLRSFENEIEDIKDKIEEVSAQIMEHKIQIKSILKGVYRKDARVELRANYIGSHPEYDELLSQLNEYNYRSHEATLRLRKREAFSIKLSSLLDIIEDAKNRTSNGEPLTMKS